MDYDHIFERDFKIEVKKRSGIQWQGRCPLPNHEDRKASFSWNIDNGLWKCHGCFESGNAYQLAEMLGIANPSQYIDKESGGYRNNPPPIQKVNKMSREKLNNLKERYHSNLDEQDTTFTKPYTIHGKRDDGNLVFFLPDAIKHHKSQPYWEGNNKKCQIFGSEYLAEIDENDTLYIFEGEKEVCYSPYKGISFTAGAGNVPEDLSQLYAYKDICIIPDNDDAGYKGADKWAKVCSSKWGASVRIAQWDETLPKGYDVYDDYVRSTNGDEDYIFDETDKAISKAIPFKENNHKTEIGGFNTMAINNYIQTYQDEEVSHIIDGLLVKGGVTILAGSDGVGKSWLGLQMGFCISNGNEFLGWETKKMPVLLIQFELGTAQLKDRLQILSKSYDMNTDFNVVDLSDEDLIFTDAWDKIEQTIDNQSFTDGVIIVDNLYASTDKDVSQNHELKPILKKIRKLCVEYDNAFVLIAHHNKNEKDDEPILTKKLITGGKTLTNFPNNVIQVGSSSLGNDIFRGKITKIRDKGSDLINIPFILNFDQDTCVFSRGVIIVSEILHCQPIKKRWEYELLIDFLAYQSNEAFTRSRLWQFLSTKDGWEKTPSNQTKVTRFLSRMKTWGFIIEREYNLYELSLEDIRRLEEER